MPVKSHRARGRRHRTRDQRQGLTSAVDGGRRPRRRRGWPSGVESTGHDNQTAVVILEAATRTA
jgi:hypothetical protein